MKAKTNVNQKQTPKPRSEKLLTFADHIKELRSRLIWVVLVFLLVSALAYNYRGILVDVILAPLDHQKLVYLTPGGGFAFIFQVTLYTALVVVAPVLIYHIYGFLKPALPKHARRSTLKIVTFASCLMCAGVAFGYFVAVPAALKFLSTFAGSDVLPNLTADSYLTFFLSYVAGLGVLFQLPLLLLLWHWINPFTPSGLLKSERMVILFAFVASALMTPTPDIFNQAMIAVPLILIYQIGVVAVLISIKGRRRHHQQKLTQISLKEQLIKQPSITATYPTPISNPQRSATTARPLRHNIDGFGIAKPVRRTSHPPATRQEVRKIPYIPRQLAKNQRPSRPMRSVDGITPLNPYIS